MDFRGKKYERGSNWSDPEVVELLQLWSDESVQIELESCLRNQHVFNRIAEVLHGKGIFRTGDQCREKIKKMKLEYRRIKENHKTMRGGRTWKFYDVMDRVLTNRPSISYSSLGSTVIAHQVLPTSAGSSDAYLHGLSASAFGCAASAAFLFNHPPKPGDLLEIKREDVNSDDGLLNSDAAPPELLYHIGSGDEPDADSKSVGPDPEDFAEMARGEVTSHTRFSPSGISDHNMAGSSGTGMSVPSGPEGRDEGNRGDREGPRGSAPLRQRKRRRAGRGGGCRGLLDEALVSFLSWQRVAEERLMSLEEARLEREAQAEERREQQEERRAEQEREHELRLLSVFASALSAARSGAEPAPGARAPSAPSSSPPRAPAEPGPLRGSQTPQHSKDLSRRGNHIRQHQGILQEGYTQYHADKHDENSNPDGIINMGTSENKLCYDLLHKRLTQSDMFLIDPPLLQYPDWKGHLFLREEMAKFLSHYCRSPRPLKSENVVVMNGCGSLFSAIAAVLCDPEDAVLIPTPFYGCIAEDVQLYSGVRLYHVPLHCQPLGSDERPFHLTVDKLETALTRAKKEAVNVRALILVNPHNPMAEIYTPQEMTDILEFAKKHELHVIVDEIYMLSVFDETDFHSVLSLDRLPDSQRTHVLWGVSKDFAMAGVRVATVHSENRALVQALDQLGCFHGVPGPTQHQVARLLQDRAWINGEFLPQNRRRMRAAHGYVTGQLQSLGVPYLHRGAGFYIWADFRKYLREPTFSEELALWRCFLRQRVLLSCGQAFCCSTPGWFRIVFTDQQHRLQLGMQRLRKALDELKGPGAPPDAAGTGEDREGGASETQEGAGADEGVRDAAKPTTPPPPEEPGEKDGPEAPGAASPAGEDLAASDCQTSHPPEKLDALIGALRQQIRSSDWLEKNTPELSADEDPELLDVFKDLLDRARK